VQAVQPLLRRLYSQRRLASLERMRFQPQTPSMAGARRECASWCGCDFSRTALHHIDNLLQTRYICVGMEVKEEYFFFCPCDEAGQEEENLQNEHRQMVRTCSLLVVDDATSRAVLLGTRGDQCTCTHVAGSTCFPTSRGREATGRRVGETARSACMSQTPQRRYPGNHGFAQRSAGVLCHLWSGSRRFPQCR